MPVKLAKKFIKDKKQLLKYYKNWVIQNTGVWEKRWVITTHLINILVTGSVVYYIIHWPDNPISYGLLVFIVTYYIKWFITLIKTPYEDLDRRE